MVCETLCVCKKNVIFPSTRINQYSLLKETVLKCDIIMSAFKHYCVSQVFDKQDNNLFYYIA